MEMPQNPAKPPTNERSDYVPQRIPHPSPFDVLARSCMALMFGKGVDDGLDDKC